MQSCVTDYQFRYHCRNGEALNHAYDQAMNKLGWEYLRRYIDGNLMSIVKRVYLLRKEASADQIGLNQKLSIGFALKMLRKQEREF